MKSRNSPNLGTPTATKPQNMTTRVRVTRNLATGKLCMLGRLFITPKSFNAVEAWEHLQGETSKESKTIHKSDYSSQIIVR